MTPQLAARIAIRQRFGRPMLMRLGLIPTPARIRTPVSEAEGDRTGATQRRPAMHRPGNARRAPTGGAIDMAPAAGVSTTREPSHGGGERAVAGSTARPPGT